MKRHLIRVRRSVAISGTTDRAVVYHTWCGWETLDKRAIAESAHVPTADMCKRCMAEVAKLNPVSYLVPPDGE